MRKAMLGQYLLYVWYTGDDATHTIAVDGDGGTGSGGLITITDDSGASAFDLGAASYDTLGELIAGVDALTDWRAEAYGVDQGVSIPDATDISAQDLLTTFTAAVAPHMRVPVISFNTFPISVAGSATDTTVENAFPVSIGGEKEANEVNVEVEVTLASGVETSAVTVSLRLGHIPTQDYSGERHRKLVVADDFADELFTVAVNASGTSTISATTLLNVAGADYLIVDKIANANSVAAAVSVFLNR